MLMPASLQNAKPRQSLAVNARQSDRAMESFRLKR